MGFRASMRKGKPALLDAGIKKCAKAEGARRQPKNEVLSERACPAYRKTSRLDRAGPQEKTSR
jgi:hypothetical protein